MSVHHDATIAVGGARLRGAMRLPAAGRGMIVFAHGSGTTRRDPVNRFVARRLAADGFGTLLMDLLAERESHDRHNVFDIDLQAARLAEVAAWLEREPRTRTLKLGYFGTGVGTGVALAAAAKRPANVAAIVSRAGRPDPALRWVPRVRAPTLFIADEPGVGPDWVEAAFRAATAEKELVRVPSEGHCYREPAAREALAGHAERWFLRYFTRLP
jgi:putative phosphoribosyl transferase